MSDPATETLLRVERGSPDALELAALTAVLRARLAHPADGPGPVPGRRPPAPWRRPERVTGFQGPRTWRGSGDRT
ncbi:acyl-CoA carboxylase subunit epsilon [Streptomyces griseocarneus]|uniref:acyl-CoA carboxylase subunit epsilon n=1 Tax=Streptomyces griseocarneus TaxID=51201 RepID=UPI00167E4C62|nr:acyl-CoA carboxylase subunit epsilon [Streptomyces griseocarneus]MBZ6477610.1 acyl-CoA carboxylase subunit epsilon [Streptomyces griseocarneus]GHG83318.1 hypothetical protein GCM10018779_66400 [Streptomyces griseocarneus]